MQRQAMIIGLGQFGMTVASFLTRRGVEVFAVDMLEDRVRTAAAFAAEAACFDATDTEALARVSPQERDVCLCAIGDEAREASIICTALLRQMGAPRVIARANNEVHARILSLVGAHRVINVELEYGERFANQILYQGIRGELSLGEGVLITEAEIPQTFLGKTLADLDLRRRFGVTVIAVRRAGEKNIMLPDHTTMFQENDVLVFVSHEGAVPKMMEEV